MTYVGRSPHEAFYTPDGKEVWVTVRGENYISVIDASTFAEKTRIAVAAGPSMQIFSPDGKHGHICSSFNPEVAVVTSSPTTRVVAREAGQPVLPEYRRHAGWQARSGSRSRISARPRYSKRARRSSCSRLAETGAITNHVNFAHTAAGTFAHVTIGGLNQVKVFRTDDFTQVATIPAGALPHGLWPSGGGTRICVGLENADSLAAIDTATSQVVANVALLARPRRPSSACPAPCPRRLEAILGRAAAARRRRPDRATEDGRPGQWQAGAQPSDSAPTTVTLFDQGLLQVLQASVTGHAAQAGVCARTRRRQADGTGPLEPLANFTANPCRRAMIGPIRQVVQGIARLKGQARRGHLVIAPAVDGKPAAPVQVQAARRLAVHAYQRGSL
ncbi:YncE family protein [Cupriavidus basilensis]